MDVYLISYTPNPDYICEIAAAKCTGKTPNEKYTHFSKAQMNHHDSIMEHAPFTFEIDGVSSVLLSHLTRHRFFSFSVTSERYSECIEDYITPPSIYNDASTYLEYYNAIKSAYKTYKNLIALGIPMEDARFVLPKANCYSLIATANIRELNHFFALRTCECAQWEIKDLANKMLKICKDKAPFAFRFSGPSCCQFGYCPEHKNNCTRRVSRGKEE